MNVEELKAALDAAHIELESLRMQLDELTHNDVLSAWLARAGVAPQGRRLVCYMMKGRPMSREQGFSILWGDDLDGGPENAGVTLRTVIWHTRKALEKYGVKIFSRRGVYLMDQISRDMLQKLVEAE